MYVPPRATLFDRIAVPTGGRCATQCKHVLAALIAVRLGAYERRNATDADFLGLLRAQIA